MRILLFLFILSAFLYSDLYANDKRTLLREGNKLFKEEKFNDAEIKYRKAQEIEYGYKSTFNLADALYKQGNYEEATNKFKELSSQKLDKKTLSAVNHNLGNSQFMSGNYEESVKSYQNALKLNPKDNDTRYNLELARRMLQKQEQEKQEQNKNQNNDKQEQDKNQEQNEQESGQDNQQKQDSKQNQDNKQQDNKQDNNQNQGGGGEEKESKQQGDPKQQKPYQISKEDAERMLNAIQKDEKELQKKLRKQKGERAKIERNW